MERGHKIFCLTVASLFLMVAAPAAFADDDDTRNDLAKEILSLTADDSCDTNEQCKSVGLGDKPCGGVNEYRIYSLKSVDETALLAKVETFNQMDKEHNRKNNMASTCDMVLQPTTTCVQGQCTAAPATVTTY